MGRMQIVLSDELEQAFRVELTKTMGFKKGNISTAIEDAIKDWMAKNRTKRSDAAKKAWVKRKNGPEISQKE